MNLENISLPEVYEESQDFRFFVDWFNTCISKIKHDIENMYDLYDPLTCPGWLLWMLADTVGYRYDDRLPMSFNRLVILYFMSLVRNKGSKDGVTLAAEVNLAQFNLIDKGQEKDILYNRLEDTSIPVNSVYVTPHTDKGYIDVVYFSTEKPIDACIEYVRPLGMYLFQHAGVRFDARTKISIDARLTHIEDMTTSVGPTHVGHYRRDDYARMQRMSNEPEHVINPDDKRNPVYYRNSEYEKKPNEEINPGYRALYSLQMSNNEEIVKSLMHNPIFSIGYGPQDVTMTYPDNYLCKKYDPDANKPAWNLRYDKNLEKQISTDVYTIDDNRTSDILHPQPAVNPRAIKLGDAISLNSENTEYTHVNDEDVIEKGDGRY